MKIAQIAPLVESVPPRLYGGTLFATADSRSPARLAVHHGLSLPAAPAATTKEPA
jgi:hypothetical protein